MKKITLLLFVALTGMLNVANAQTAFYTENFESNVAIAYDSYVATFAPSTKAGTWSGGVNLETVGDANIHLRQGWGNQYDLLVGPTDAAVTIPNINVAGYTNLSLTYTNVMLATPEAPFIEASVDGGASWVTLTTVPVGWGYDRETYVVALPVATSTISLRINPPTANDQIFNDFIIKGTAGASGINQLSDNSIQVYPNPATNYILAKNAQKVTILDLNGRIINEAFNTEKVDVSSLAKGVYIVKVQIENATKMGKLIKE